MYTKKNRRKLGLSARNNSSRSFARNQFNFRALWTRAWENDRKEMVKIYFFKLPKTASKLGLLDRVF